MYPQLIQRTVGALPLRYHNSARQFIKFIVTGSIGAIVDFSTYNILTRGLDWTSFYTVFGQPILLANNISVLLAIISNFLLNKYWTFRNLDTNVVQQGAGYFTLNAITWTLNQLLVSFFTFQVPLMVTLFGTQRDNAAKALAIGCILFINFFGSKFVIFRKKPTLAVSETAH